MELKEILEKRRSIRKFKSIEISDEKIGEVLQLAQLAPSAGNVQAYKIKIVKSVEDKKKLMEATMSKQEVFLSAPVVLVICADPKESESKYAERGRNFYAFQDATIFAAYIQLVLVSMGFDSVWVGGFIEDKVKEALLLPENLKPVAIIPFGYPDGEPRPRERKKVEEILLS